MKKHQIKLEFFNDDATGDWGLAHENAIDIDTPFNAFWNGIGIFHDIFEHWFEDNHKYFEGINAFNIGGEMTAMGCALYYYYTLGLRDRNFNRNGFFTFEQMCINTTFSEIEEAISEGYARFGDRLECGVPYQKDTNDYNFEGAVSEYAYKVHKLKKQKLSDENYNDEIEFEFAKDYQKSLTETKVRNLHRYGYKLASKLVPDNKENRNTLSEFIEFWNEFCKKNPANELVDMGFKGITFEVFTKNQIVSWKATLVSGDNFMKDYVITSKQTHYIPDHYTIMSEVLSEEIED